MIVPQPDQTRPGRTARPIPGGPTEWDDGIDTYVLSWHRNLGTWLAADLCDDLITVIDRIRHGETPDDVLGELEHLAKLGDWVTVALEELILMAREQGHSWREIGAPTDRDHTGVRDRHARIVAGRPHRWRAQIVDGTPRAALYRTGPDSTGPAGDDLGAEQDEVTTRPAPVELDANDLLDPYALILESIGDDYALRGELEERLSDRIHGKALARRLYDLVSGPGPLVTATSPDGALFDRYVLTAAGQAALHQWRRDVITNRRSKP